MCGCNPPLPAIYLEVKKDNHNKVPLPSALAIFANEVRDANSTHVRNHGKSSVDCSFGPKMQRDEKELSLEKL
jgi:hypothetical protein